MSELMTVSRFGQNTSNSWRYVQQESGYVITGRSYYTIEEKVIKHRKAMGYDLSDGWKARFQDDLCKQNLTVPCKGRPASQLKPRSITLQDLKRFFKSMLGWTGSFVEQEEANRRAKICSTCPDQTQVPGCFGCAGVGKLLHGLIGKRATTHDHAITGACKHCLCNLQAKVWFPKEAINTDGLALPTHCWMNPDAPSSPTPSSEVP